MLPGQITLHTCIKQAWLHGMAFKILGRNISPLSTTCISFSLSVPVFLPPSLSSSFLFPSCHFYFDHPFPASCLSSVLPSFFSSSFPFFFFSFASFFSCFMSSFGHWPVIYLPVSKTLMSIMECRWRSQGRRRLAGLLGGPLTVTAGVTDISVVVFVCREFSTISQCPSY